MHFLSLKNFSNDEIKKLVIRALELKQNKKAVKPKNTFISNIFLEPSTRTLNSFKVAEFRCGLKAIDFDVESSSMKKGESFFDTIISMRALGISNFVIRSTNDCYCNSLLNIPKINLINAGTGTTEHPSQTLLDLVTIYENFGNFKSLKIAFVGDIYHSRVFHGSFEIMQRLGLKVAVFAPKLFAEPVGKNIQVLKTFDDLKAFDIVYFLRIQHERHTTKHSAKNYNKKFGLNSKNIEIFSPKTIFMHPGPVNRDVEMTSEVIYHKQSFVYKQIENGVFARMAILEKCCQ